eukprot:g35242.t1
MNGCIAKGELLGKSVKRATEMLKENPDQFVTLTDVPTSHTHVPHVTPDHLSGSNVPMVSGESPPRTNSGLS